ncbi:hypothetical protein [Pseudomonas sp. ANT_J28]|uniref:hypothetical protein n=1 Tax=Pseudomonas sp. ANT_J28 TaxID=2597352 RepID=UPI0011F3ED1D|nr:hypothetical protein [Pseudomonas sp. ANT_J28]KAA0979543.1 hypothetical protein FQ187_24345 [Pseudomonas sp. ANT_J28]
MKRYLRCCLIFLISLALPLSGMAGVQAPTEPCPMKTMGMAMMDGMGQDCCHDMKSPTEHGKPCKPGQECKSGSLLQVSIVKHSTRFSSPLVLSLFSDFLPVHAPSGVWRPPRI